MDERLAPVDGFSPSVLEAFFRQRRAYLLQ
jgi:hypothetical protein